MAQLRRIALNVRFSYRLLAPADRVKYNLSIFAQLLLSLFDLLGVLVIGAVGAVSVLALQDSSTLPNSLATLARVLGLSAVPLTQLALILGVLGCFLLLLRSCISVILIRWIYRSLAAFQIRALARIINGYFGMNGFLQSASKTAETEFGFTAGANQTFIILLGSFSLTIGDASLLIVLCAVLLFVDPLITVSAVAFFGLIAFTLQRVLGKRATSAGRSTMETDLSGRQAVRESITLRKNILIGNRSTFFAKKLLSSSESIANAQSTNQLVSLIPRYVLETALILGSVLLIGSQTMSGSPSESAGKILIFLAAGSRILPSLLRLQVSFLTLQASSEQTSHTHRLAQLYGTGAPGADAATLPNAEPFLDRRHLGFSGNLELVGVNFAFPNSELPLFSNFSMSANSGEAIAIVGASGAGKSTLMDLILGVIEPDSGAVQIGGVSPREAYRVWPGAIGYIPQDVPILHGDIRSNLSLHLGSGGFPDVEFWNVLEQVGLEELFRSRDGLDTRLIGGGVELSGGQRQRLGIARALLSQPKLLVMDEATSSLDSASELLVSESISNLRSSSTLIVVAHRLSLIKDFDRIYFLENGRCVGSGNFETLRRRVEAFNRHAQLLGL